MTQPIPARLTTHAVPAGQEIVPRPLSVLKFGGSVLRGEADLPAAVEETRRFRDGSRGVVVVVSAFLGQTDHLLARGRRINAADPASLALLAATGELTSVAFVTLALRQADVPAVAFDAVQLGLRTTGGILDADPSRLDTSRLRAALAGGAVVVAPGFVGRDVSSGGTTLLGRGGSDLTAVFVSDQLRAERCRLIKDVDGIFDCDPALPGPPARRFETVTWDDALRLGGGIVQERCLRYARSRGLELEVGAWGSERATRVGRGPSRLEVTEDRVSVALAGEIAGALA